MKNAQSVTERIANAFSVRTQCIQMNTETPQIPAA